MKEHCWFCDTKKEFNGTVSNTINLAYGVPFPVLELTVKSIVRADGKVISFVCEDCRRAILHKIAESRVAAIDNVLAGAKG